MPFQLVVSRSQPLYPKKRGRKGSGDLPIVDPFCRGYTAAVSNVNHTYHGDGYSSSFKFEFQVRAEFELTFELAHARSILN